MYNVNHFCFKPGVFQEMTIMFIRKDVLHEYCETNGPKIQTKNLKVTKQLDA